MGGGIEIASDLRTVQIERLPVSNFMPPEGVEFTPHAYVAIPAQGAQAVVVQFDVPPGFNGVINRFANEFVGGGFQQGQGLITWVLYLDFLNLVPAPNFQSIVASLGSVNNPKILNGIRIKEKQRVTLLVKNAAAGVVPAGQQIGGLIGGYFYPVALTPGELTF
jgi:hypothetical protein